MVPSSHGCRHAVERGHRFSFPEYRSHSATLDTASRHLSIHIHRRFDAPRFYRRGLILRFLVVLLAALGYMLSKMDMSLPIGLSVAFFLIELFFGCYFLHAETYALRPERDLKQRFFIF